METANNHFGLRIAILAIAMAAWQLGVFFSAETGAAKERTGMYFAKKAYEAKPLPKFAELRSRLPSPIYDDNPVLVRLYWKAWELAFHNFYEPAPQSGFVSQFIDAAFNKNIFLWDSCFMTMFCNYAYPLVPGISSLDNFYAKQHEDGEICREIVRNTGTDFDEWVNHEGKPLLSRWGWPGYDEPVGGARNAPVVYMGRTIPSPNPKLTLDALNHPILAWAELEHYRVTRQSPISWVGAELDRSCTFWSMPSDSDLMRLTTGWCGESDQGAGAVASASALTGTLYL